MKTLILALKNYATVEKLQRTMLFTFFDDRLKDYLYKQWLTSQDRKADPKDLHRRASSVLQSKNLIAYGIWHKLQSGEIEDAFSSLMENSAQMNAQYLRSHLLLLHTQFRIKLWQQEGKTWEDSLPQQKIRWYVNQGKLAEILYYGFSLAKTVEGDTSGSNTIPTQDEWELIQDALIHLKNYDALPNVSKNKRLSSWISDTNARCRMLQAIFVFEKKVPKGHYLREYSTPRRNNLWLAKEAGKVLHGLATVHGHEGGKTPPLNSMVANFQGCYYNGGGGKLLSKAIQSFQTAARILDNYESCLQFNYKSYLPEDEAVIKEFEHRFHRDRLDIANNWSRSRFLLKGPNYALDAGTKSKSNLEHFKKFVDDSIDDYHDSLEFCYCLVDICYYYFAKNDLANMKKYLNMAYDLKGGLSVGLDRFRETSLIKMVDPDLSDSDSEFIKPTKWGYDDWVEGAIDALEVMHYACSMPRNSNWVYTARKAFKMCAKSFDGKHFGYSRDSCLFLVNSLLIDLCNVKTVDGKRQKLIEIEQTLKDLGADDEPIAADTLVYLQVLFGMKHQEDSEEISQSVKKTAMRFPRLIGKGKPSPTSDDWCPPFLMRGALMMVPTPRAPLPIEFGISDWTPCP